LDLTDLDQEKQFQENLKIMGDFLKFFSSSCVQDNCQLLTKDLSVQSGLTDFIRNVAQVPEAINNIGGGVKIGVDERTNELVESFVDTFKGLKQEGISVGVNEGVAASLNTIVNLLSKIASEGGSFKSSLSKLEAAFDKVVDGEPIPIKTNLNVKFENSFMDFAFSFLNVIFDNKWLIATFLSFIFVYHKFFSDNKLREELQVQGGQDIIISIGTSIVEIFLSVLGITIDVSEILYSVTKKVRRFVRAGETLKNFFNLGLSIVNAVLEYFNYNPIKWAYKTHDEDLAEAVQLMSDLYSEFYSDNRKIDQDFKLRLRELEYMVKALERRNFMSKSKSDIEHLRNLKIDLRRMQVTISKFYGNAEDTRAEPLGIVLVGLPGCGKSAAVRQLAKDFATTKFKTDFSENQIIFNRCVENKFWDGYTGQPVCLYDDLGQQKPAFSDSCGFQESIRTINTNNFHLHMSDIPDKGNTYFKSSIVVATSNLRQWNRIETVRQPKAVCRRFKMAYWTVPKPEVCEYYNSVEDHKISPVKLEAYLEDLNKFKPGSVLGTNGVYFDNKFTHLDFYKIDLFSGEIDDSNRYSYVDLLEEALNLDARNDNYAKSLRRNDSKILKENPWICGYNNCDDLSPDTLQNLVELAVMCHNSILTELVESGKLQLKILGQAFPGENSLLEFIQEQLVSLLNTEQTSFDIESIKDIDSEVQASVEDTFDVVVVHIENFLKTEINRIFAIDYKARPLKISTIFSDLWIQFKRFSVKYLPLLAIAGGIAKLVEWFSRESVETQGSTFSVASNMDQTCRDMIDKYVSSNVYLLECHSDKHNKKVRLGYVTFVGKKNFYCPRHFHAHMMDWHNKYDDVVVSLIGFNQNFTYTLPQFLSFFRDDVDWSKFPTGTAPLDIIFGVAIDSTMKYHPNMVSKFVDKPHADSEKLRAVLVVPDLINKRVNMHYCDAVAYIEDYNVVAKSNFGGFATPNGYRYRVKTKTGDCGALLVLVDTNSGAKRFLGNHVAGSDSCGISFGLTSKMMHHVLTTSVAHTDVDFVSKEITVQSGEVFEGFKVIDKLDKPVFINTETKICPSPLVEIFGPSTRKPAHLKPFGDIDPMQFAREQYLGNVVELDQHMLDLVTMSWVHRAFHDAIWVPDDRGVMDIYTAIRGIEGDKHWKPVSRKTSPGYPWILKTRKPGKQDFFGSGDEWEFDSDLYKELENEIDSHINNFLIYQKRVGHVYRDFLKDELRPIEKADAGKTRMVSGAPLDHLIEMRMFFGNLARFLTKNNVSIGIGIGANPYSHDWTNLVKYLRGNTTHLLAGDYKHYDGSLTPQVLSTFLLVATMFYGHEDYKIRDGIMQDIVASRHVYRDIVYEFYKGMPSGNPMTGLINSVVNQILIHYNIATQCLPGCVNVHQAVDLSLAACRAVTLGDDNIISLHSSLREFITFDSIVATFKDMGFTYTDEVKGNQSPGFRDLYSISFLKRGFRFVPGLGRFLAPLSMDTILDMPRWTKKGDEEKGWPILASKLQTCLYELALHGEEVFTQYASSYLKGAVKLNVMLKDITYDACLSKALNLEQMWE